MKEMVSFEEHRDGTQVVTILDDAGRDADLEVHFKERGPNITVRQHDMKNGGGDVIVMTPLQAAFLMELLVDILGTEGEERAH